MATPEKPPPGRSPAGEPLGSSAVGASEGRRRRRQALKAAIVQLRPIETPAQALAAAAELAVPRTTGQHAEPHRTGLEWASGFVDVEAEEDEGEEGR